MLPFLKSHARFGYSAILVTGTLLVAETARAEDRDRDRDRGREESCRSYEGTFSAHLVQGPPCESPIGLCSYGEMSGEMTGAYDFTMDSLQPAGDPNDPAKYVYTGTDAIIHSIGGKDIDLIGTDTGVMEYHPTAPSPFRTTVNITGGTYKYKHARGHIIADGVADFMHGTTAGTYRAVICHRDDD